MATKEVREVINLCKSLGLDPVMESGSGHYKVRDPKSGAYVFGISSTPSDPNFKWMIMRHLRRLGLLRDGKKQKSRRRKAAIDLAALKRAQDQAASAGHRIPMLEDLEDSTEFFYRTANLGYSEDAQEEAIDIMAGHADAPRVNAARQRLISQLIDKEDYFRDRIKDRLRAEGKKNTLREGAGGKSEFTRIAIEEVGPQRGLKVWKTHNSAQNSLKLFLEGGGLQIWAVNLIEATMDHIDGLKWNEIDESRKRVVAPPESQFAMTVSEDGETAEVETVSEPEDVSMYVEPEPTLTYPEDSQPLEVELVSDGIRDRYADVLLEILRTEGSATDESVLNRLDKLAGIG